MPDNSFIDIESLSKLALENAEPNASAPDWSLINDQLNKAMPQKRSRKRLAWWSFSMLCLLLLMGTFGLQTSMVKESKLVTQAPVATTNTQQVIAASIDKNGKNQHNTVHTKSINEQIKINSESKKIRSMLVSNPHIADSKFVPVHQNNGKEVSSLTENKGTETTVSASVPNVPNATLFQSVDSSITAQSLAAQTFDSSKKISNSVDSQKNGVVAKKTVKSATSNKFPLSLGVLYGADFTHTNYFNATHLSSNVGLMLQYRLPKWSIATGIIFTKKQYTTTDPNFLFDPVVLGINNTAGLKLQQVYGHSHIVEIPIQLSRYFSIKSGSEWFVTAGLSTYLMENERFNYSFVQNGNNFTASVDYTQHDEKNDDFSGSVIHLSGGFQSNLSNGYFYKVEPYVKIPISRFGMGDVRLFSVGVSASFYLTPFKKPKK